MSEKSKALFNIVADYTMLVSQIIANDGEMTNETEAIFSQIENQLSDKVDKYAYIEEEIDSKVKYFKGLSKQLDAKVKALETVKKELKSRLKESMIKLDKKTVSGDFYKYTVVNTKRSIEIDNDLIQDKYYKEVTEKKLDKKLIEEDLDTGVDVLGAKIRENKAIRKYFIGKKEGKNE